MSVIYLTSWYNEQNEERRTELLKCITRCKQSKDIDKVVLLGEREASMFLSNEISWFIFEHRPTFNDFFTIANEVAKDGDVVIIANTDVYPEEGVREHLEKINAGDCYALARWDEMPDGSKVLLDRWDTGDVWVFRAPIKQINGDFYMGWCGCDNAIADRIENAGYSVKNPSKTIKFNHLHNSGVRNYKHEDRVGKPYLLITPHELGDSNINYHHIL